MAKKNGIGEKVVSMENWIWSAACSIRGAQDAPKYKDFILPLIFVKRLCDVYDGEIDRIAKELKSRIKAWQLVEKDKSLVRFYLPLKPKDPENDRTWDVIRKLSDEIGQELTDILRKIAKENPSLQGIIDRVDFNATTHGQRDLDDTRLSKLIEKISEKKLGLNDVEPDIIGRSYEYLIRKFAENSGKSAGEFYTPTEVGILIAKLMDADEGMEVYDPCCGSGGLLVKCQLVLENKMSLRSRGKYSPLQLFGQEYTPSTWAMSKMNMVIHDMEGDIEIGDTMSSPKFSEKGKLRQFDRVVANPMWNQTGFKADLFNDDPFDRFEFGYPGNKADWGWMQHITSSLKEDGKAAVVLGIGSATRGSNSNTNGVEKRIRKEFLKSDLLEAVILLPFNLFYNTDSPGVIYIVNKKKEKDRKGKFLFINASDNFLKGKPKNFLSEKGAVFIQEVYEGFQEVEGFSKILSISDLQSHDFVFNPSRYVLKIKPIVQPDFKQTKDLFKDKLEKLEGLSKELNNDFLNVNNSNPSLDKTVFGLISGEVELKPLGLYIKQYSERAGEIDYSVFSCSKVYGIVRQDEKFKNAVASEDKSNYKIIKPNMFAYDPMLLWDGSIGRNYYSYPGILSPAYTIFEVNEEKIDLDYLDFILKNEIMLPFYVSISDGTNMRRRKAKFSDFKKILIPVLDEDQQKMIGKTIKFSREIHDVLGLSNQILFEFLNDKLVGSSKPSLIENV